MQIQEKVQSAISLEQVIRTTQELIAIPSAVGQEGDLAEFIVGRMSKIGLEVRSLSAEADRPNLLCRYHGRQGGKTFLLVGHMDTIPLTEQERKKWLTDPYKGVFKDNRIYGLGASDMKGAVAAMIVAIESVIALDASLLNDVVLIFCVDEECGSTKGMQYLIEKGEIPSTSCLAVQGEPTNMKVQGWFKGWAEYEIITRGKSAHSSRPDQGVNAIEGMLEILHFLREYRLEHLEHPMLGKSTWSLGKIEGGVSAKMVPDCCKATIEVRLIPGQSVETVTKEIEQWVSRQLPLPRGLLVEVNLLNGKDPAEISTDNPFLSLVQNVAREVIGKSTELGTDPIGGGDINLLIRHLRIPGVLLGPGLLEHAHSPNEFVPVKNVLDVAKIYASLALRLCGSESVDLA